MIHITHTHINIQTYLRANAVSGCCFEESEEVKKMRVHNGGFLGHQPLTQLIVDILWQ